MVEVRAVGEKVVAVGKGWLLGEKVVEVGEGVSVEEGGGVAFREELWWVRIL